MACSAAEQAAQDITAPLVLWEDAVPNHKGSRTNVVGDDPQRDIRFLIGTIDQGIELLNAIIDKIDSDIENKTVRGADAFKLSPA